jgi:hypothetical protein
MTNEKFGFVDEVEWVHRDKNGKVIKRYNSNSFWNRLLKKLHLKPRNCITKFGMAEVAGLILTDVSGTDYDYLGIGTGVTAATVNDDNLETQVGVRQASTGTRVNTTQTNDTAKLTHQFSQAEDATLEGVDDITEVGVFNASGTGDDEILSHQIFSAESIDWDQADTFEITVKIQIKQGS